MALLFKALLLLHITGGSIGLLSGTLSMVLRKGDKRHKLIGKFFLYSMLTAGIVALPMSVMHSSYFLFIVGIFTIYMVSTGTRYLSLRRLGIDQQPLLIDWALTISMLLFGVAFIAFGIYHLIEGHTFGIVFIVFGGISTRMVRSDIRSYTIPSDDKNNWLLLHLQRMVGTYIAAITAFLVVNLPSRLLPDDLSFVPWLLPTLILTPLIFKWSSKHSAKKKIQAGVTDR